MDPNGGAMDEGPKGFLSIFKSDDAADTPPRPDTEELTQPESVDPEQAVAAEPAAPERPDGGETAADRVAANLAASLEADGVELPEAQAGADEETGELPLLADGRVDISKLSPEQLQAYVEDAIALREQISQQDIEGVTRELTTAETNAESLKQRTTQAVQQAASQWIEQELDARWEQAQEKDDPKAWFMAQKRQVEAAARDHYSTYLQGQLAEIDGQLKTFKRERLKPHYAEWLLTHNPDSTPREIPLPQAALQELLKVKDPDDMPSRADELMQIANYLGTLDLQNVQQQRVQARKQIVESTVRSPGTGTPVPRERKPYQGSPEEGAAILSFLHKPTRRGGARSA
jgi:hypothetical protein